MPTRRQAVRLGGIRPRVGLEWHLEFTIHLPVAFRPVQNERIRLGLRSGQLELNGGEDVESMMCRISLYGALPEDGAMVLTTTENLPWCYLLLVALMDAGVVEGLTAALLPPGFSISPDRRAIIQYQRFVTED